MSVIEIGEKFVCGSFASRSEAVRSLTAGIRAAIQAGEAEQAAAVLRSSILPVMDFTSSQALCRMLREVRASGVRSGQKCRLAVLGGFTTKQLVSLIDLYLFAAGVDAEIYESDYGVFRQEILDPQSGLYQFAPQTVFLATTWRDLVRRPLPGEGRDEVSRTLEREQADWHALWELLHARLGCQVIQNNVVIPPYRSFANHELRQPGSFNRYLMLTNSHLVANAPPFVAIHDVDHLASLSGRWAWDDPRFVHHAKLPCSPECLIDYGHSLASLIGAQLGLAKKCLVLDLDNTLWGGVIGDDGLGGIRLGQGDAEGEAFLAFQHYVKSLQDRGVILAVCSKNNDQTAREVFEKHSEMVIRLKDVSCFVANWDDKATNLRNIASTLNIGTNSLVFVDDNPAERAIVRRHVPEVAVPELPLDVAGYAQSIEQHRYFQVLSIGAEDFQRTSFYRADSLRKTAEASAVDMGAYLRSLEMTARVAPIDATTVERSAQLIQRSNQFNLTTRRRSAADLLSILKDESFLTLTITLNDKFGDSGLISVILAQIADNLLIIDTWLMSCRVLKRGVEQFVLNHLVDLARQRGVATIRGEYIPTSKNSLVKDHYSGLGFTEVGKGGLGSTLWELNSLENWVPLTNAISETAADEFNDK